MGYSCYWLAYLGYEKDNNSFRNYQIMMFSSPFLALFYFSPELNKPLLHYFPRLETYTLKGIKGAVFLFSLFLMWGFSICWKNHVKEKLLNFLLNKNFSNANSLGSVLDEIDYICKGKIYYNKLTLFLKDGYRYTSYLVTIKTRSWDHTEQTNKVILQCMLTR